MVVIDRWSLKQGFPETDRFFEALLNSCERCGTHAFDLRNDNSRQSGPSGGLMRWFSCKLALWCCSDSKYGDKATLFLAWVAKDRENPVLGAKNAGRWSRCAGGRQIQVTLNGRLSVHEKSVAKSRWSLRPVVASRPGPAGQKVI